MPGLFFVLFLSRINGFWNEEKLLAVTKNTIFLRLYLDLMKYLCYFIYVSIKIEI